VSFAGRAVGVEGDSAGPASLLKLDDDAGRRPRSPTVGRRPSGEHSSPATASVYANNTTWLQLPILMERLS